MGYRAALLNFTKGEISPELEARFDLAAYQAGMRRAYNVKIRRTGGVSKRMGTRFVSECLSSAARLFPFQFSDEQGYALEMGQAYMRPLALGGAVLETGLKITAITQAANAKVTAALHGYSVGDQVYITTDDPLTFGMAEILDRWLTILTVPNANQFTLDIDSTGFTAFGSDDGVVNATPPPPPPTPPPVPPPAPDPTPPDIGSGGGGGYTEDPGTGDPVWQPRCVATDTLILLDAENRQAPAGSLRLGQSVYTRHEKTLEWGYFTIAEIEIVRSQDVYLAVIDGKVLRATPDHRVYLDGKWQRMRNLGRFDGKADIVQLSVHGAKTYVSNGILSHNLKLLPEP